MRVLVADDERLLADTVAVGLRRAGLAVDVCYDGDAAHERISVNRYDVAVLDRDMPGQSGDDVCRAVRAMGLPTRVLLLTAAASIRNRVDGLSLGADDYLVKPFAFAELVARVHALSRRSADPVEPVLDVAGIVLDPGSVSVRRDGQLLDLTPKEYSVLHVLMRARGSVVSAEDLLEQAWDENIDAFSNVVRVTIMTLRRKLGDPPVVHTVLRSGYRLAAGPPT